MHLSEVQRLTALVWQADKSVRKLHSVQARLTRLLLAAGDLALTEDTLDEFEKLLDDAARTLAICQAAMLSAREASDSGLTTCEGDCN